MTFAQSKVMINNATSPGDREIGPGRSLTSRLFDQESRDVATKFENRKPQTSKRVPLSRSFASRVEIIDRSRSIAGVKPHDDNHLGIFTSPQALPSALFLISA
jgi:hypothetical protein